MNSHQIADLVVTAVALLLAAFAKLLGNRYERSIHKKIEDSRELDRVEIRDLKAQIEDFTVWKRQITRWKEDVDYRHEQQDRRAQRGDRRLT